MSAYGWCPVCERVETVDRTVVRPQWLKKPIPHWGPLMDVDLCEDGHALTGLCDICGKFPSRDGVDSCLLCWPVDCDEPVEFKRDTCGEVKPLLKDTGT